MISMQPLYCELLSSINNLDLQHEKRQKEGTYSLSNIGSFLTVGF